jgi:hypothetical protein
MEWPSEDVAVRAAGLEPAVREVVEVARDIADQWVMGDLEIYGETVRDADQMLESLNRLVDCFRYLDAKPQAKQRKPDSLVSPGPRARHGSGIR